jgi:3-oxoacyl-(acyl-carrier-protein) synthase
MTGRVPVITGMGIICSAGTGKAVVWSSLETADSGLKPLSIVNSSRHGHAPAGEVTADLDALCGRMIRGSRSDKLAYIAALEALHQAGFADGTIGDTLGPRAGVVLGCTVGGELGTEAFLGNLMQHNVRRYGPLRYHECASSADLCASEFGCFGPVTTVSTACSGGALSIAIAGQMVSSSAADLVIAGGCDSLCRLTVDGFGSLFLLDPDGCRPFDRNRSGINLGEGAGVVVIESRESAEKRGIPILATLSGWGTSCDAFHATAPESEGKGAELAMSKALHLAGLPPSAISHINAHGTATHDNDLVESRAIKRLFGEHVPPILSTKGLIGHTLAASGAIDAVISVESLSRGGPPQSVGFSEVDPEIGITPVQRCGSDPQDHVLSNAFGFGGNNVSLIISKPPVADGECDSACSDATPAERVRLFVTGLGMVSPWGGTVDALFDACSADGAETDFCDIGAPLPAGRVRAYRCPQDFGASALIAARRRRRLDRIQLMTLVAAGGSFDRDAFEGVADDKLCVAIGTGLGATAATAAFIEPLLGKEEDLPSPQKFTNAVHNALASQVAIEHSARGLNSTMTHREVSFENALWHAANELSTGSAECAIAGAADELTPYLLSAGKRWGWWPEDTPEVVPLSDNLSGRQRALPGEGATVFCISPETVARRPLAELVCTATGRFPRAADGGVDAHREALWIEQELAKANLTLGEVDLLLSGANGYAPLDDLYRSVVTALNASRGGDTLRHGAYKHLCGEYHAASAFGMALAVGLVGGRVSPAALLAPEGDCRVVLLYTLSETGTHALTCIRRVEGAA